MFALEVCEMEKLLGVNRDDQKTQKARLMALKNRRCLFITAPCISGMSKQMKNSIQWIVDQGVIITAVFHSEEDGLFKIFNEGNLMEDYVVADLKCQRADISVLEALGERIFDGVFSPYEPAIVLAGEIAEALKVSTNPGSAYKIARSKNMSRESTRQAGLATPRSGVCKTPADVERVVTHVGFPCIMKPSSGAGSCGVLRADSLEQSVVAFEKIQKDLKETAWLQWSPGCEETTVLVEQCLIGDEFDIDMLMWEGECVYQQCVDNWPCIAPFYLETGSQMPSLYPDDKLQVLKKYATDCVKAMGFRTGCFHVEAMYTTEGPVLIEINARQGGGPNQVFNIEMCGVDIFANFFMAMMNIPINPPRHEPSFAMADYAITSPFSGVLVDDKHADHIRAHPDTYSVRDDTPVGSKVQGLDQGFPQWLTQFVIRAPDKHQAKELVESLVRGIETKINIKPAVEAENKEIPNMEPEGELAIETCN